MGGIAHLTSVHPRTDSRIRIKQVATLAGRFHGRFFFFVQDGLGEEKDEQHCVSVIDIGTVPDSRFGRMIKGNWRMWKKVRAVRPCIAHFHDPELIPVGLLLKLSGIKVIYDVHEDLPVQILVKQWIPGPVRVLVSRGAAVVERLAAGFFDAVVAATPTIGERFPADKTITVHNYPIPAELQILRPVFYEERRPPYFAYIGGLTRIRGAREMVEAVSLVANGKVRLCIAGLCQPLEYQQEIQELPGWKRVKYFGWADRMQVAEILGSVRAGLVVLQPTPNYKEAYPIKMFEYMAAGLPVIASDFPLWRRIIDEAGCGLLVDPLDPRAIARAMQWILDNPKEAEAMGCRGKAAVAGRYNWDSQAVKLVGLYQRLLGDKRI
jgi:glycosyltransferase involved in cell wall biosynthesis